MSYYNIYFSKVDNEYLAGACHKTIERAHQESVSQGGTLITLRRITGNRQAVITTMQKLGLSARFVNLPVTAELRNIDHRLKLKNRESLICASK